MLEFKELTDQIIGCAIEVYKHLGPGLLESIYEAALCIELERAELKVERQVMHPVFYKGKQIGEQRIDLLVAGTVILELKSVERLDPIFQSQLLSYLKFTGKRVGLLINFNTGLLKDAIKRFIVCFSVRLRELRGEAVVRSYTIVVPH